MARETSLSPPVLLGGVLLWAWTWWAASAAAGGSTTGLGTALWVTGALGAPLAVGADLRPRDAAARRAFGRRLVAVRGPGQRWWLAALAVGGGPKLLALGMVLLAGGRPTGEVPELTGIPLLLVFLVVAVWIEEPLWRGVALDGLQARRATLTAAVVIGLVWALWHVPLFWLDGTYQHDLGRNTLVFWLFLLSLPPLSVLLSWPVVGSGGAVSLAVAAHLLGNVLGELLPGDDVTSTVETVVLWLGAGAVAVWMSRSAPSRAHAR
jgi:uncharacterized protein